MLAPSFGCTDRGSLQALREELQTLRGARVVVPPLKGFRDLRGVIHTHSYLSSDSNGRPEEFLAGAQQAKLDYLVMTDHFDPRIFTEGLKGQYGDLTVISGAEFPLGCTRKRGVTRRCGSILGFGFSSSLAQTFSPDSYSKSELIAQIKRYGGLVFLGHARGVPNLQYFEMVHGMEVFNIADTMRERYLSVPGFMINLFATQQEYHEELLLSVIERPNWLLARWDQLTRTGHRFVGIGGNDAHQNLNVLGVLVDPYGLVYRILNTHVLVDVQDSESAASPSANIILAALSQGRCYLAFSLLCDASGFQFYAINPLGTPIAMMGDVWGYVPRSQLVVRLPRVGAIEIFKNGVPEFRTVGRELEYTPSGPGVYRVEVFLKLQRRWRPWIISNPIYLLEER
tara:strand:+ start:4619 stop:5812 length:1194 start_codon:yes stop_codon:yes gene_type:complete